MLNKLRFLLIQIRDAEDAMRGQEPGCFARVLGCDVEQIEPFYLLDAAPSRRDLDRVDMVLIGGSGRYSATSDGAWLVRGMEGLRLIHDLGKPTFASCWGFQAMARAMGGRVINDLSRAELGTHELRLTKAGREDPVFGPLGRVFLALMGHEDLVEELPVDATLLASTDLVTNQAYRFNDKPIYCTQFHPELNREAILQRVRAYPEYVERIAGMTVEEFDDQCEDTPLIEALLPRFVQQVFGE